MPNTEVKLIFAENTRRATARENKLSPALPKHSSECFGVSASLAQSVEHAAVNRRVVGSSPTGGASLQALK